MFARFAGIGISHDAVLLERHAHGLGVDVHADDEEDNEPSLRREPAEDRSLDPDDEHGEDEDEDEDEDGSDSEGDGGDTRDDDSSGICF